MTDANRVVADPAWLAHRYDPVHDAVHFRFTPRSARRQAVFLTDAELGLADPCVIRRREAVAMAPPPARVHFLFHSAFCCSTLLARALDIEGVCTSLKEPVALNDIAGWRQRGSDWAAAFSALDGILTLLQRSFDLNEATLVKPSSVVNGLAPAMLDLRPDARAVFMYAPLPQFLGSIARKGHDGRLWARDLLRKQLRDGTVRLNLQSDAYLAMSDLQAAAITWLGQSKAFGALAKRHSGRLLMLDSDALLAAPMDALRRVSDLFGLPLATETLEDIAAGPAFSRHSKTSASFNRQSRASEQRVGEAAHCDEIARVLEWAAPLAAAAGVEV